MRDDYDDAYTKKITAIDFSCSMVLSMKKTFFGTGVNACIEDKILRHLFTCAKCRRIYENYAREIGYKKFNLVKYAIRFAESHKELKSSETRDYLGEVIGNKKLRVLSRPWTTAVNTFDIDKLMNMKAFRDLCKEYDSPEGVDYSDFIRYITLRFAKHIDHLEECLIKEGVNPTNEKSK